MASMAQGSRISAARLNWLVILIGLSVLLNYVDRGAIGIAAPLMKAELELSATGFGTAVSAFFWVYAPLCLFVGWLCDRFCVYRMFAADPGIGREHCLSRQFEDLCRRGSGRAARLCQCHGCRRAGIWSGGWHVQRRPDPG